MSALLQRKLKEHLETALAPLKLAGPSPVKGGDDTVGSTLVFIGDIPPKRRRRFAGGALRGACPAFRPP